MNTLKETIALVGAFNGILSAFCAWVWLTGGPKEDGQKVALPLKERKERARAALAIGTAFIWVATIAFVVVWAGCYLVVKAIG